jgi:hypothetical protein
VPINRECPKCGELNAHVRHNCVIDELELSCGVCRYEWRLKPLDVLRADKERQRSETTSFLGPQ